MSTFCAARRRNAQEQQNSGFQPSSRHKHVAGTVAALRAERPECQKPFSPKSKPPGRKSRGFRSRRIPHRSDLRDFHCGERLFETACSYADLDRNALIFVVCRSFKSFLYIGDSRATSAVFPAWLL